MQFALNKAFIKAANVKIDLIASETAPNADILRFVQQMIALRKRHPSIMRRRFLTGSVIEGKNRPNISWHGTELNKPLWHDPKQESWLLPW